MHQFSIITPTFNRARYLPRIYDCLCQQGNIDIEWIIVDDGSSDNTKEIVKNFNKIFEIKYIYQINSGQVSAWNTGMQNANSYIFIKLDDDDVLLPNTFEKIWTYFDIKENKFEHNCVCVSGLCQDENGNIIGDKYPHDYIISDHIRYIRNKSIRGDKCEFFITEILKKYPFPIIENEKNIAPSIIFARIALTYKTIYINQVFEEKQYLQGGLSTQNYYIKYPQGSELVFNERSIPPFKLVLQIKHSALYIFFAKMNHKKYIFSNAKNKFIFPLGLCAYCIYIGKKALEGSRFFHILTKKETKVFKTE